jgi:ABC-type Fe3+/spermidine/putrescine transport system ATPase subunit
VAHGPLRLRVAAADLKPGAAVLVSIRPHEIHLAPGPPPAATAGNVFAGRVRRASYLGAAVEYQVEVAGGGLVLRVTAPESPRLAPGDAATLTIDPAACVALE